MDAAKKSPADSAAEREIGTTRLVNAAPEELFAAFRDPERLAQWWGPKDFTSTFQEFDLRPGGKWRLVLHGPDGTDYPNEKVFLEVIPPTRIVIRHNDPTHGFVLTLNFLAQDSDRTLVAWQLLFDSATEAARVRPLVTQANEQNLDRLEAHLPPHS